MAPVVSEHTASSDDRVLRRAMGGDLAPPPPLPRVKAKAKKATAVSAVSRGRHWCFTIFERAIVAEPADFSLVGATYTVFQREVCPDTARAHLQGFVSFPNARSFKSVQSSFPEGTHLERARGSPQQASDYCKKDESRDPAPDSGPFVSGMYWIGPGVCYDLVRP